MSSFSYLIRKAEEETPWRELKLRKYDVDAEKRQDAAPGDRPGDMVPPAAAANLVITRPDSFSLSNIEKFLFRRNVPEKPLDPENLNPFQEVQAKDGAASVVQSTALQFTDVNGTGALFASNGAPESLSDKTGEMRSLLEPNAWRNRPSMV